MGRGNITTVLCMSSQPLHLLLKYTCNNGGVSMRCLGGTSDSDCTRHLAIRLHSRTHAGMSCFSCRSHLTACGQCRHGQLGTPGATIRPYQHAEWHDLDQQREVATDDGPPAAGRGVDQGAREQEQPAGVCTAAGNTCAAACLHQPCPPCNTVTQSSGVQPPAYINHVHLASIYSRTCNQITCCHAACRLFAWEPTTW
jgi:hypothetical protein